MARATEARVTDTALALAMGCGVGVVVGFVLSLLGAGGSVLATPLLLYGVGVSNPQIAIGTSSCAVAASAAIGAYHHAKSGTVRWRIAIPFALAGMGGALLGSIIAKQISGKSLIALFGLLIAYVAFRMLQSQAEPVRVRYDRGSSPARVLSHGIAAGTLSGFFGVGGGFLCVPAILAAANISMVQAVGSSLVAITAFGFTSMASYATSGLVDWPMAFVMIVGGMAGTTLGTYVGQSIDEDDVRLRKAFGLILAAVALAVLYDAYSSLFGS